MNIHPAYGVAIALVASLVVGVLWFFNVREAFACFDEQDFPSGIVCVSARRNSWSGVLPGELPAYLTVYKAGSSKTTQIFSSWERPPRIALYRGSYASLVLRSESGYLKVDLANPASLRFASVEAQPSPTSPKQTACDAGDRVRSSDLSIECGAKFLGAIDEYRSTTNWGVHSEGWLFKPASETIDYVDPPNGG